MGGLRLPDLPAAVRRRWLVVLLLVLATTAGGSAYALSLPDRYESAGVLSLTLEPEATTSTDLIRIEAPRYAVALSSPAVLERADRELGLGGRITSDDVAVTTSSDTGNVRIAVTDEDPQLATALTRRLIEVGTELAAQDPLLRSVVTSEPVTPRSPVGPRRAAVVAAAAVLGLALGLACVAALELRRPLVHDTGALARRLPTVLAWGRGRGRPRPDDGRDAATVRRLAAAAVGAGGRWPGRDVHVAVVPAAGSTGARDLAGALSSALSVSAAGRAALPGTDHRPAPEVTAAAVEAPGAVGDAARVDGSLTTADAAVVAVPLGSPLRAALECVEVLAAVHVPVLAVVTTPREAGGPAPDPSPGAGARAGGHRVHP
ncbi:YveK family protein [Kineococcus sp. SYSU DK004]|uniref:hypothetical protein n=1 Tax=Kineococcus sp. SYSU DK004 TaxID=3383125 RepID=UPI003D7DA5CE